MKDRFSDNINFISKLSYKKVLNVARLYAGYYFSRMLKKPVHWGMPTALAAELSTCCNLKCAECPTGNDQITRKNRLMDFTLFKNALDELHPWLSYLTLYFQGEPYLHPEFFKCIEYAVSRKIYTATSTNGHFLEGDKAEKTITSGLDRLIISLDGTTKETYSLYRKGGDFDKVIRGIEQVVNCKKNYRSSKPFLILQFLAFKHNQHQIHDFLLLGKKLGVDRAVIKTAQINDRANIENSAPSTGKYSRYQRQQDGSFKLKNKLHNHCWRLWSSSVIACDGAVVPCCYDKTISFEMGNITQQSFKKIWKGNSYRNFRYSVLLDRKNIEICTNCTEV